ncbi:MAG: L,D-transpeptidase family protein [Acidimicrobiales bacterium]
MRSTRRAVVGAIAGCLLAAGGVVVGRPSLPLASVPLSSVPLASVTAASYDPALPAPQYLDGVGNATKVVEVVGAGWNSSQATMALWQKQADGSWALAANPFPVYVGEYGWAFPSQEHEGGPPTSIPMTLRSPVGSYSFGTGFGWSPDPGYGGPWLNVTQSTYWNESPNTPGYNSPVNYPVYPWSEHLIAVPQYDQAAFINYNAPGPGQVQGQGSGIFLHDDPPGYTYTAGCVGVPNAMIDTVLRFIDVADTRIIMGPASDISTPPPPPEGISAVTVNGQRGYYIVNSAGQVRAFGGAVSYGDLTGVPLNAPIVGITATADGRGYYLLGADGGVFAFGDAVFRGSTGALRLNAPVVSMAVTPSGSGYWLVAADGGIFSFGAPFYGSTGNLRLNQPVDGVAVAPGGSGYWLVAKDGGVFTFTADGFYGSLGNLRLNAPIVGMASTGDGRGYTLVGADGGVFNFGDSPFYGSLGSSPPPGGIVALAGVPGGQGYYLLGTDGAVYAFGPGATYLGGEN